MQTMILLIFLFGLFFGIERTLEGDIPGTYVRRIQKHSDLRQFGRTLTLNCDSTALATFQGDMMNETVKGSWTKNGDTVIVSIDEPLGHWNKENLFLVQNKKLIYVVTEINGEKISNKQLLNSIHKENKKYAYKRSKKGV